MKKETRKQVEMDRYCRYGDIQEENRGTWEELSLRFSTLEHDLVAWGPKFGNKGPLVPMDVHCGPGVQYICVALFH
jgi:hypothetical protein